MPEKLIETVYPDDREFWTGDRLFPFMGDCKIICSISIRNIGKTYAVFSILRNALSKGWNIAISRYDRIELGVTIQDFLRYYEERDEDGELICHYKEIRGKHKEMPVTVFEFENGSRCYFMAIKDSPNLKGLEIPKLYRWYIDEFVPLRYKFQTRKYREFDDYVQLYHTLVRTNFENLRVIMTANCNNWMNPYFIGLDIPKFKEGYIMKIKRNEWIDGEQYPMTIAVENVKPSKAMRVRFIKTEVQSGRKMEDVIDELEHFAKDPDCFIATDDNASDTGFQIKFKDEVYGVYVKNGKNYIRKEPASDKKQRFLLTPAEYDEDFIFERAFTNMIEKLLFYNRLRFDCRKTESNVRLGVWMSHTTRI
jgi:hypothetical protein